MAEKTLKEKTAQGLLWGAVNNGLTQLLNILFGIWLGRLLSPGEYGMVGMIAIFSAIASVLQESGFTSALTNMKAPTHKDYNAVFWFSALMGATLYVILFCCAPLIAAFLRQPALVDLSRVVFLGFFIACVYYIYDDITNEMSEVTAYYLGLIDECDTAEDWDLRRPYN